MGRFYKTATPQNIDYAFRFPTELLAKAVAKKDTEIDTELVNLEKVKANIEEQKNANSSTFGKGRYMAEDEEDNKAIMSDYEQQITDIAKGLTTDWQNTGKYRQQIGLLRSKIAGDLGSGDLYTQNKNFNLTDQWLKENKDSDPMLVQAALVKAKKAWGSSRQDGKLKTIELPTLYNADIKEIAKKAATQSKNSGTVDYRTSLIANELMSDENVRRNMYQKLEYGLLVDDNNAVIDATEMTDAEKAGVIEKQLIKEAKHAATLNQPIIKKPTTTKKTKKELADEEEPITTGRVPSTEQVMRNNVLGEVLSMGYTNQDGTPMPIIDASIQYITDVNTNENSTPTEKLNAQILQAHFKNARKQAGKKFELEKSNTGNFYGVQDEERDNKIIQKNIEDYFNNLPKSEAMRFQLGWENSGINKTEQKEILDELKKYTTSDLFENNYISSPDPRFNNKTIKQLKDSKIIRNTITNKSELETNKTLIPDKIKKFKELNDEYKNDNIIALPVVNKDGAWIIEFKNTDGGEVPEPIVTQIKTGKENFKLGTSIPQLTKTVDEYGNRYFRMNAEFTNDDGNKENIPLYINTAEMNLGSYNKATNATSEADFLEKEEIKQQEIGAKMYHKVLNSNLAEGTKLDLSETVFFKIEKGNPVLYIRKEEGTPIAVTESKQIIKVLGLINSPNGIEWAE